MYIDFAKIEKHSIGLVPTIAGANRNKNIPNLTTSKARPIEYVHDSSKTKPFLNIVADYPIFEVRMYDSFFVTSKEYFRLLRRKQKMLPL